MKFTINKKLLLVALLPIVALLLFSINHISEKYTALQDHKKQLAYSSTMNATSNLIHELQKERGLATAYLNNIEHNYFLKKYTKQIQNSNIQISNFNKAIKNLKTIHLSRNMLTIILSINEFLLDINKKRELIKNESLHIDNSFLYYTNMNNYLLELTRVLKLQSNDEQINTTTLALQKLIMLKEYAGQERALVEKLVHSLEVSVQDLKIFHTLVSQQNLEYKNINYLFSGTNLSSELKYIHTKYKNSYIITSRDTITFHEEKRQIINEVYKAMGYGGILDYIMRYKTSKDKNYLIKAKEHKKYFDKKIQEYLTLSKKDSKAYRTILKIQTALNKVIKQPFAPIDRTSIFADYKYLDEQHISIDPKKWFNISSSRINELFSLENILFKRIINSIHKEQNHLRYSLIYEVSFIILVIFSLLFLTIYTSRKITNSVNSLSNGVTSFFEFLNFKIDLPKQIVIDSDDEIKDMATEINRQMLLIQNNIEDDKDFIHEATAVVSLMRDGDFSERVYYEPNNPSLVELKNVLNELINLIAEKVKEQTTSLERLNTTLEDKVYHQTNELNKQVEELTISRDKAINAEIAKDEFLANMSHEIRTPLNAILGFVTILKKQVNDPKSIKYLSIIDASGNSLLRIINDILDFSKIQSGKFIISMSSANIVEEFSNSVLLFASKAYEKNLVYSVYIDPNIPKSINLDMVRVEQILINLLSNAIKFTPEDGEVKVKIIIKNSHLLISIQDTGIGISKENQAKVFSAFEQADGSTTRKYGGTGLGLSISSRLAALMYGKLTFVSEEGVGSTFTLDIPIEIIDEKRVELISDTEISRYKFAILNNCVNCLTQSKLLKKYLTDFGATQIVEITQYPENDDYDVLFFVPDDDYNEMVVNSQKPSIAMLRTSAIKLANLNHIEPLYAPFIPKAIIEAIHGMGLGTMEATPPNEDTHESGDEVHYNANILIVEDNKTNQMLISLIVDDYRITFDMANDGVEAVAMFKKGKYDLVLMDENMPNLNGIGAMKQIKAYEEQHSLILTPIIALTASVLDSDKEMFTAAGMDGFIAKPIDTKELEIIFNKYLHKA